MPNWVNNQIQIDGSLTTLQNFYNRCEAAGGFSFGLFMPIPDDLKISSSTGNEPAAIFAWTSDHFDEDVPSRSLREQLCDYFSWDEGLERGRKTYAGLSDGKASEDEKAVRGDTKTKEGFLILGRRILSNIMRYGAKDWYNWCIKNWGTKWDVEGNSELTEPVSNSATGTATMNLYFETAWSFPQNILEEISRQYPDLVITGKFADEDIGSNCGIFTLEDGLINIDDKSDDVAFACNVWGYDPDEYLTEQEE